jgi:hypothetical protein
MAKHGHMDSTVSPEKAEEFIHRLITETGQGGFREYVEKHPRQALKDYGIDLQGQMVPDDVTLPDPGEIQDAVNAARGAGLFPGKRADEWVMMMVVHPAFPFVAPGEEGDAAD